MRFSVQSAPRSPQWAPECLKGVLFECCSVDKLLNCWRTLEQETKITSVRRAPTLTFALHFLWRCRWGNKEICPWCLRLSKIPKIEKECRTDAINPLNAKYESCSTWISILNKPKGPKGTLCWATGSFPEINVMFCWRWRPCYFTAFQNKLDFRKFLKTHREPQFFFFFFCKWPDKTLKWHDFL